jgi:hypothetical protein
MARLTLARKIAAIAQRSGRKEKASIRKETASSLSV